MTGSPNREMRIVQRLRRGALALVLSLAVCGPAAADDGFVDGFADLPLMPGMQQAPDATVEFDSTSGRIVVSLATTASQTSEVLAFYGRTLAQLGWRRVTNERFSREGEQLTIEFIGGGPGTVVRFNLKPE